MGSLVIVALPEEDDRVHKISSEKAPHLTLLYLGDVDEVSNVDQIVQFVEHAVTLSEHGQFYLDVDHRGELGEEKADVLFFNKKSYNLKWIKQFRGQLLQNDAVRTAYDTADQFGAPQEWTPHLTLGYPETPANDPSSDDAFGSRLYSVCFDRIAVWVGDSDGPEFRLEWPDREYEGDLAIAYSDASKAALTHYAHHPRDGELAHFGVKGMKWGVRQLSPAGRGAASKSAELNRTARGVGRKTATTVAGKKVTPKKLAKLDKGFEKDVKSARAWIDVHNHAADHVNARIDGLNSAFEKKHPKEYKDGTLLKDDHPVTKEYHREYIKLFKEGLEKSAAGLSNASGTRTAKIKTENDDSLTEFGWKLEATDRVRHAADDEEGVITFVVKRDASGRITKVNPAKDTLEQTATLGEEFIAGLMPGAETIEHGSSFVDGLIHGATTLDKEFVLAHYGVKGMRWGQRKTPKAVTPSATSVIPAGNKRKTKVKTEGGQNHPASSDAIKVAESQAKLKKSGPKALSNQELREVATRVQLEQQAVQATRPSSSKFIRKLLGQQGNQFANEVVREGVKEGRSRASEGFGRRTATA